MRGYIPSNGEEIFNRHCYSGVPVKGVVVVVVSVLVIVGTTTADLEVVDRSSSLV
jgi:hypothetical protein